MCIYIHIYINWTPARTNQDFKTVYSCVYIYMFRCIDVYIYIYIHICICICVYIYVYSYIRLHVDCFWTVIGWLAQGISKVLVAIS